MNHALIVTMTLTALLAAGCKKAEVTPAQKTSSRTKAYFDEHMNEAMEVRAQCIVGTVSGAECANADAAVDEMLAREANKGIPKK